MSKLKMLSGLPGSGKTTLARELVEESGNAGRINRDDLRAMLFNSKWFGPREGIVVEVEKAIARVLLNHGQTPIIDDTNLTVKHHILWLDFCEAWGADLDTTVLKTDLKECIRRDSQREKPVGEAVINRMALWAGMIDFGPKPIVICDIDGTIADGTHREHHLAGDRKDWKTYYSKLHDDLPIEWVMEKLDDLKEDHTILMVSGRPDTYGKETLVWLRRFAVPFDHLFMRAGSDRREDSIIKKEILDRLPKEQIVKVFDDRPRVCRMWESEGLDVEWCRGRDCPEF